MRNLAIDVLVFLLRKLMRRTPARSSLPPPFNGPREPELLHHCQPAPHPRHARVDVLFALAFGNGVFDGLTFSKTADLRWPQ